MKSSHTPPSTILIVEDVEDEEGPRESLNMPSHLTKVSP